MKVKLILWSLLLSNQRRANKKEALELDNEIENRLSAAQTTLHIQVSKPLCRVRELQGRGERD